MVVSLNSWLESNKEVDDDHAHVRCAGGVGLPSLGTGRTRIRLRVPGFGFQVSGIGYRVSGFGFRFRASEFRVSGFRLRVSNVDWGQGGTRTAVVASRARHTRHARRPLGPGDRMSVVPSVSGVSGVPGGSCVEGCELINLRTTTSQKCEAVPRRARI